MKPCDLTNSIAIYGLKIGSKTTKSKTQWSANKNSSAYGWNPSQPEKSDARTNSQVSSKNRRVRFGIAGRSQKLASCRGEELTEKEMSHKAEQGLMARKSREENLRREQKPVEEGKEKREEKGGERVVRRQGKK